MVADPLHELSLAQLRERTSVKWRAYPEDVLPLWVAEMDVLPARPVVAAVNDALERGDTGYTYGPAYAESLAAFARARWDWHIDVARTTVVPDVMLGAVAVLDLLTTAGDAVVVNPPVYPPFYPFIAHSGRRVLEAPLDAGGRLDLDRLEAAFGRAVGDGRRAAYLLCNPHNPTGTVHTARELRAVAELAAAYGVRVVSDEIHAPLVLAGARFVPYLSVAGSETGFALLSASKGWNLPGLKAAVVVAGGEAGGDLARMPEEVGHGASHVAAIAHTAAFSEGGDWLDDLLDALATNRRFLVDLLARELPEVVYRPGEGTYLAWLDCRGLGLGEDPAAAFLERARVALVPGPDFGTGGEGHARLNLATSRQVLTEAVRRMALLR